MIKRQNFKYSLILLLCIVFITSSYAMAEGIEIDGKVINQDSIPVQGVTIYLINEKANMMIKSAVTDQNGVFYIQEPPAGVYIIEASAVGYSTKRTESIAITQQSITLEPLVLHIENVQIESVQVEGRLPQIQQYHGKTIMNVENSSLASGSNALEIVKRAPGISVDNNDNIQLMGRDGVNVTIDGRQTYMTGDQLATLLKATDGSQIKSIEVSTTRSAKEDAEGSVGTINIVLKKNKLEGFNGTFNATGGHGKEFLGNSSLSLNYKKNNTSLFGSYSYDDSKTISLLELERILTNEGKKTAFDQSTEINRKGKSHNYRIGIEQITSDRNIITAQFNAINNATTNDNISQTYIGPQIGIADSTLTSHADINSSFDRYSFSLNNEFKIDTTGKKLTGDFDWSKFNNSQKALYRNEISVLIDPNLNIIEDQSTSTPSTINILSTKLDYTQSIGAGILETGLKYSHIKTDNNLIFKNLTNNYWELDPLRSNHFIYTEEILAAYIDYSTSIGNWGLKGGLRGEETLSKGKSITLNEQVKRKYFDLFPSVNVSYSANENNILSLSYAKKITRPNYKKLNPFEYFLDKFTSEKGNPYLKPQYTESLSLSYTFLKMFTATLGYDYTYDAMVESIGQDSIKNTTWVYLENLAKQHMTYLNINAPFHIGKIWSMNNNITLMRFNFKGPIAGDYIDQTSSAFRANSTHYLHLPKGFSTEIDLRYMSPIIYNVYKLDTRWSTDVGLTKKVNDRSTFKIAVSDIFNTNNTNLYTDFGSFDSKIRQNHDTRVFRLTYTYRFGNLKQNQRRKATDSEEQNRAQ